MFSFTSFSDSSYFNSEANKDLSSGNPLPAALIEMCLHIYAAINTNIPVVVMNTNNPVEYPFSASTAIMVA